MRPARYMCGLAGVLACLGAGASVALGAGASTAPAGGAIRVFVKPGHGQGNGKILITGAIGDYGTTHRVSGSGGRKLATATLKKGTITFDLTTITHKMGSVTPVIDKATCSASVSATAPVPVVSGTGLYSGIHGTVRLTESFGFLGSTYKSGPKKDTCNMSNSAPELAGMGVVYGHGTVRF